MRLIHKNSFSYSCTNVFLNSDKQHFFHHLSPKILSALNGCVHPHSRKKTSQPRSWVWWVQVSLPPSPSSWVPYTPPMRMATCTWRIVVIGHHKLQMAGIPKRCKCRPLKILSRDWFSWKLGLSTSCRCLLFCWNNDVFLSLGYV